MIQRITRLAIPAVLALVTFSTPSAAQGVGIKAGPTFATFSSEALDFDSRTGIHAGLFLGGSRDKVVGMQTEFNWLRKNSQTGAGQEIRIDYLQIPALLRVNAGSSSANGFAVYGIIGPALELKIGDEIEGITLDDGFEGADVSLVFGGGIEVVRIIVEARYEKGLRRINKTFSDLVEIKKQAFTILFGLRFK
jgi:Outer membrane protein beta-barrel domain